MVVCPEIRTTAQVIKILSCFHELAKSRPESLLSFYEVSFLKERAL
jgi:hypothetical protein